MLNESFEFRVPLIYVDEGVMHLAWPANAELNDQQRHSILEELVVRLQQDDIRIQPQGISEPGFCYLHADPETWQEKPMVVSSVLSDVVHSATERTHSVVVEYANAN